MEHEKYINNLIINKQIIGLNTCIVHDNIKTIKAYGLKCNKLNDTLYYNNTYSQ